MLPKKSKVAPDSAYLGASLANLGKIVGAIVCPDQIDRILNDCNNGKVKSSWKQSEARHGFYSHEILGEIGAAMWGAPPEIIEAISCHHEERGFDPLSDIVRVSNQLVHWVLLRPHRMNIELLYSSLNRLGIDEKEASAISEKLTQTYTKLISNLKEHSKTA